MSSNAQYIALRDGRADADRRGGAEVGTDALAGREMGTELPYELVWESRCLVRRYSGLVTGEDLVASLREVCSDPRFDEIRCCIADYSRVESLTVCEDNAMLIAALQIGSRYTHPDLVIASVATDPAVVAEIKRLAGLFQPEIHVHFHPTAGAACRWIRTQGVADCRAAGDCPSCA